MRQLLAAVHRDLQRAVAQRRVGEALEQLGLVRGRGQSRRGTASVGATSPAISARSTATNGARGDGVGDELVAGEHGEVGQRRVGAVEQAQLDLLVRGARRRSGSRRPAPTPAARRRSRPRSPTGVNGSVTTAPVVARAERRGDPGQVVLGGGRGDPVHHRGGEASRWPRSSRPGPSDAGTRCTKSATQPAQHVAVVGEVVAAQHGDRAAVVRAPSRQAAGELADDGPRPAVGEVGGDVGVCRGASRLVAGSWW